MQYAPDWKTVNQELYVLSTAREMIKSRILCNSEECPMLNLSPWDILFGLCIMFE